MFILVINNIFKNMLAIYEDVPCNITGLLMDNEQIKIFDSPI